MMHLNPIKIMRCVKVGILFCIMLLSSIAYAQSPFDSLVTKFSRYRNEHLQEKIFVQLDRTTHLCGETIWFSIYCLNGTTHQPLGMSKVAYVEILSAENESVVHGKVELVNGAGAGSFFLPATLLTGNYVLRAYTNWMKNNDPEFFFHQPITIINTFKSNELATGKPDIKYDAQFLPEGGNLVNGITGTVGFRVTNAAGKGIDFQGVVVNAKGDTLVRFTPSQFGIGSFSITPTVAETYRAAIRDTADNVTIFPFPKVLNEGYTLHAEKRGSELLVNVQAKLPQLDNPTVYLFVHTRNQLVQTTSGIINTEKLTFTIPASKLDEGVTHITLFDARMKPVCERLIFQQPHKKLDITPKTNQPVYQNREAVTLTLDVSNEAKLPESADLSVSVYKLDSLPAFKQHSINTYLLLTSDLHGTVESPETYFELNSETAFDQLMLTHGWRRFSWDNLQKGSSPNAFLPEIQGLTVNGKLLTPEGKPAPNLEAFASVPSRSSWFFTSRSKRNGDVSFILKNVHGDRKIIFQTNFLKDSLLEFKIDNPYAGKYAIRPFSIPTFAPSLERTMIDRTMGMQVQDIFKAAVVRNTFIHDTSAFYGKADETYFLDDFTRFTIMEEVLREYVPGVLVRKRKGEFYIFTRDNVNESTFREVEPLVLIDGVRVFDTDKLMAFDPLKVKKLEVITKIFFQGQSAFAGVVSFSTYTGDLSGFEPDAKSVIQDFEGLQPQREFYQPAYELKAELTHEPDQRNVLLFAPHIKVKDGKAQLTFYTSDVSGNFQIEAQGLSKSGRMGNATQTFWVREAND